MIVFLKNTWLLWSRGSGGQNLIKFRGVKLPGGIELNGRELYDDAERELEQLKQVMMLEHELPPLDFIG